MKLGEEQIAELRAITPGAEKVVHFNNAGCSLPSQNTLDAVVNYLHKEATIGGYETLDASEAELKLPYTALASLLNCHPDEIAITTSATEAWQQVVYGLAWTWNPGDCILTSLSEYGSNYIAYLQLVKRTGVQIEVIPETPTGAICLQSLEAALTRNSSSQEDTSKEGIANGKPVLVTINHVPTSSGRVYNAEGVGALTRKYGVPFLLDACQSVGQMPVDVQRIGCDFLSGTGRKYLRGPRGSGFLYCSRNAMATFDFEPATLDNTGAAWVASNRYEVAPTAKRFERYEMSKAAIVGLGVAVQACVNLGIDSIWERIASLANVLRQGLREVPGVEVLDQGEVVCGIVSFIKQDLTPDLLQKELYYRGINTSISRIGSSRLDFENRGLTSVVRASVHYYNTEDEVRKLIDVVGQL